MAIRPVVIAVVCVGMFLMLESLTLPTAMALKSNGFRMDDQRSHKRRNYIMQRARDKEILKNLQKRGVSYETRLEALDAASTIPEQLAYIVDYANTIDDEYFLDKSIETRTRKRGNIKFSNQAIPEPSCTCQTTEEWESLVDDDDDNNVFPIKLLVKKCNNQIQSGCAPPYKCKEIYHRVPILKKKYKNNHLLISSQELLDLVPNHLNVSWYAMWKKIPVGCLCSNKYTEINSQK